MPKSPEPPPGPVLAPTEGPPLQALGQPSGSFICEMPNCGAVSVSVSSWDLGLARALWLCLALRMMHFRKDARSAVKVRLRQFHVAMISFLSLPLLTHSASRYFWNVCSVLDTMLHAQRAHREGPCPQKACDLELLRATAHGSAVSLGPQNLDSTFLGPSTLLWDVCHSMCVTWGMPYKHAFKCTGGAHREGLSFYNITTCPNCLQFHLSGRFLHFIFHKVLLIQMSLF